MAGAFGFYASTDSRSARRSSARIPPSPPSFAGGLPRSVSFGSASHVKDGAQITMRSRRRLCEGLVMRYSGLRIGDRHAFRTGRDRWLALASLSRTFAVSLLEQGVAIETISMLLGHSGVKITEKHYKPWVKDSPG